jgi:hypothetical protein
MLKSHVSCLVVCDPRKNALLKDGIESDRIDARKSTGVLSAMVISDVRIARYALLDSARMRRIHIRNSGLANTMTLTAPHDEATNPPPRLQPCILLRNRERPEAEG